MDRREEATDFIRYYVWAGGYDGEQVFDIIDDEVFDADGENDDWLREQIDLAIQRKKAAERDWPNITDCDRLDRAFDTLADQRILTQHKAGTTQQDGLDVVERIYAESGGDDSRFHGYCFYTLQDMEAAMWGEVGLWLAFGHFSGEREPGEAVGREIRDVLVRFNFAVVWDGSIDSRLLLSGFRWQRRSP